MKKFLVTVFLSVLFCNVVQAQECAGSPIEIKKFGLNKDIGKNVLFSKLRLLSKWNNCHGTLIGKDGSQYVGEFKWGKFSGQGTFTYDDGAVYEGGFKKGKSNGYGTYKFSNNDLYVGEFK